MENENKHCYGCKYYKPYYTKGYMKFDRCDIGLCVKKKATVERHEACEEYSYKHYSSLNRKQTALKVLVENINLLAEIKQILEEDDEEAIAELFYNFKNRKK